MPVPSDPSLAPPKASRLPPLSWWLLYSAAGGYGLWQTAVSGSHHVPALTLIMAVLVMTIPMIVVHELGHFITGWLLGLRMIEFSIGTGPVLWQHTVRELRLVIRQMPLRGHVIHLEGKEATRFKRILFIAAGPMANVLLAVLLIQGWNVRLSDFFRHPTLPSISTVANLWLALLSLNPVIYPGGNGSDGWLLWRLLQGKPVRLAASELPFQKRRKTGLSHLQTAANNTRDLLLLVLVITIGILSLLLFLMIANGVMTGITLKVALLLAALLLPAWWVWRQPWTSFVMRSERVLANPHSSQAVAYSHAVASQAEHWGMSALPEHAKLEMIRLGDDPSRLTWLHTATQEWPQVRYLQLLKFDALLADRRYTEVEQVMQTALGWEGLPPDVRIHFESCRLAARLCAVPDEPGIAACDAAISEPMDDGLKMQRLHAFASTAAHSNLAELLPKAREWCEHAHQTYPFDPATHRLLGIISAEQGRTSEARSWLHSAANAEGFTSATTTAWLAIISAMEGHQHAESLLRKSLKQELSFPLKRRVEDTLAAIPAVIQPASSA